MVVKVIKIWRSSGESNKLRYVYPIWGTPGDIANTSCLVFLKFPVVSVLMASAYFDGFFMLPGDYYFYDSFMVLSTESADGLTCVDFFFFFFFFFFAV